MDWKLNKIGTEISIPASVPGCIHTDLLLNELIDDPFYGENESKLQWVGEAGWVYSTNVFPDPRILEKERIDLVFEGLDTYAEVYLNDSLILSADNMFRTWIINVKGILMEGENILSVVFSPPGEINKEKAEALSYALPDERAFTRKSPYHFGWDWGPEFLTCGIWKSVYFRAWNDFRINKVHVSALSIDADPMPVEVNISIDSDRDQDVFIEVLDDESGNVITQDNLPLKKGVNNITLYGKLEDPELWWPVGLGEQKIYSFTTKVSGGNAIDEMGAKFGIREIKLIREPDEYGESFFFEVNGLPVFMKGANYVPQDNFLTRVDTTRYEALIASVVDANMNMLRVWGGGFYENDLFYDLCDRNGILVWQDFMFACTMYPGDEAFLDNVKAEAIDNVARLSNHPSIALWCGNNEIDEGWHNWGWQKSLGYSKEDSAKVWNDYLNIFHNILPGVVEEYDQGTVYWPSSPMTGWGRDTAYTMGDVHYWGVWWGEESFEMYQKKIGRFVSEYGFQGMPPIETIESFVGSSIQHPASSIQHPASSILEAHQKHPRGTELIQKYMEREFIVPEKFEDYVYVSQVLQAEGMGQAFYTHRIAQPYCMGTLYWQLNDCWPVTSWSGLDYYGRWKALHYHVKRAFSPLMIRAVEFNGQIFVFALNDHPSGQEIEFLFSLQDFEGKMISETDKPLELLPQSKTQIFSMPVPENGLENVVFVARMYQDEIEVTNTFLYFLPTKDLSLPDPGLTFKIESSEAGLMVILHAEKLARQVFLDAQGLEGRFDDNFFDMAAGESRKVLFKGNDTADELSRSLKVRSIFDTL